MAYCPRWSDGLPVIRSMGSPIIIKGVYDTQPELVRLIVAATGADPFVVEIPPKEYNRLLRTAKFWTEQDIRNNEKGWIDQ